MRFHPPEMATPFSAISFFSKPVRDVISLVHHNHSNPLFHFRSFPAHPSRNQTCAS